MLICLIAAVLLFMVITVFLFLPCTYSVTAAIRKPFRFAFRVNWFRHAFLFEWDYTFGQKPHILFYVGWKERSGKGRAQEAMTVDTENVAAPDSAPVSETPDEERLREALSAAPPQETAADRNNSFWWWKPYILQEDFLAAAARLLLRILYHTRIRTLQASGSLGLGQPHETGMAAGFLYMLVPAAANSLRFNFLEEEYDCRVRIAGRIYPGALIIYTAAFILSQPVRRLIYALRQRRKEIAHG